jgi:hypothetical protein
LRPPLKKILPPLLKSMKVAVFADQNIGYECLDSSFLPARRSSPSPRTKTIRVKRSGSAAAFARDQRLPLYTPEHGNPYNIVVTNRAW